MQCTLQIMILFDSDIGNEEDEQLIGLVVEPSNTDFDADFNTKHDDLRAQLQFHNMQMSNIFKDKRTDRDIGLSGHILQVGVCKIPSDGNCLFGADVHQRLQLRVGSTTYDNEVAKLRKDVVDHINVNLESYKRELLHRIYERRHKQGNTSKIKDNEKNGLCKDFLKNYLSKPNKWGGSESIKAFSELYKANVIIFKEGGEIYFGNSFNPSYEDIIILLFTVSGQNDQNQNHNHYDSIVKLNDDALSKCTSILMKNDAKNCSLKNISNTIVLE